MSTRDSRTWQTWTCRATVALVFATLAAGHAGSSSAASVCTARRPRLAQIEACIRVGMPVTVTGGRLSGTLHLPLDVRAPVILRDVVFAGRVVARSTLFEKLVDFDGSSFRAGAVFTGATFGGPAVFAGVKTWKTVWFDLAAFRSGAFFGSSRFHGTMTFERAEFDESSRFRGAWFLGASDFDSSAFRDVADFGSALFVGDASFNAAEFGSIADFSGNSFAQHARFVGARFAQFADFIGRTFGGSTAASASFYGVRFDGGASFLAGGFDGPAIFDLVQSPQDMVFDGVDFETLASFSTARLLGATTFAQAHLRSLVNFDQAVLSDLNLDGADMLPATRVELPTLADKAGHVDQLRFDPSDVGNIGSGTEQATRPEREQALALVQSAAKRSGDDAAANTAQVQLQTLRRRDDGPVAAALDWALFWGVAGYFVLPLHQVVTLVVLLLIAAVLRIGWRRWRYHQELAFPASFRRSVAALWRLNIHDGPPQSIAEALVYKALLAVLLLNLVNGWSQIHDLLEGLLP